MNIQSKWKEGYRQLKNIIRKLAKGRKEKTLQPLLQPYQNKQRY